MIRILGAIAAPIVGFQLASHGAPPVVALVGVVVGIVLWKTAGSSSAAPPAPAIGHSHGERQQIALHEAGHAIAAQKVGGYVKYAWMTDNEGAVGARLPNDPVKRIAFYRAGREAVKSSAGCEDDDAAIKQILRDVKSSDRSRVRRDGFKLAQKITSSHRGEIRRYAKKLDKAGEL